MRAIDSSYFFMVFLGVTLTTVFAGCPDADKVSPCKCDDEYVMIGADVALSCSSTTLDQVKTALGAIERPNIIELVLDDIQLGALPSNFFAGFNILRLDISDCYLDSLNGDGGKPLSGLENSLQELEIIASFTGDNELTKLDLSHMRKLTALELSFNTITHLSNDWFANGPFSLSRLVFSNNNIEKVDDQVFANLNDLDLLYFDGNRFGQIKRSMLPNPAKNLDTLELDNNAFTSIPEDLFSNMPELKYLSLDSNGLTKLDEKTFKPIWTQLQSLEMRGNPLVCDSHIDWIKTTPTSAFLSAKCEAPQDMKDVELDDLVKRP